jgi:spore coat polysaccharide biosynthesis predicted glycosyltransferase SpsG
VNSSKYKVLFRCDAANITGIGTGHLYRCITIAQILKKKYNLKFKDIAFAVQSEKKFKKSITILKKYKFKIVKIKKSSLKINSDQEANFLKKNPSNLIILDRLGKTNLNFYNKIKNSFYKKIIIDDISKYRKYFDLSLNPLNHNVQKFKNSFIGFDYLILPSISSKKNYKRINKKNILIFFGGYDAKNFTLKILKILNLMPFRLNIFLHNTFKKKITRSLKKNNLRFFNTQGYVKALNLANISITAAGIGLFDSIYFNKKIICTPQYKKQEINVTKESIKKVINLIKINDKNYEKKFYNTFLRIYNYQKASLIVNKLQKKLINKKKLDMTMKLIFKLYEKSQY